MNDKSIEEAVQVSAEKIARMSEPNMSFVGKFVPAIAEIIRETCFTLRPIEDAPRDGNSILLKMKDDPSIIPERCVRYRGIYWVGKWVGGGMEWVFAAPVGHGGFPDEWIEGWYPLPPLMGKETNDAETLCD